MKPVSSKSGADHTRHLVAVTIVLNLIFWGILCWILQEGKHQYELRAKASVENIAKAVSQSLSDELDKVDLIVLFARDEIHRQLTSGGIEPERLNAHIALLKSRLPELSAIRATDSEGIIRYGIGVDAASTVSVVEDEYFTHLRDHPDAGPVVSKPKYCKISRSWVVMIARAYRHADGSFAGVVSGAVEVDYLISIFTRLDVGQHGLITLRDSSFAYMARHPKLGDGKFVGERIVSPEFHALLEAGNESGIFSATSPYDGVARILSFNRLGNWPLYLCVGLSGEDYLSVWRTAARNGISIAAMLSLISFLAAWRINCYQNERAHFIDTLKQSQDMFRGLTEMSSDWIWEQDRDFKFTHVAGNPGNKQGFTADVLLGKTRWDLAIDPEDSKWLMHRAVLEEHRPFQDFEHGMLDANGSRHSFIVSGKPIFNLEGDFQGYRGVTKDITERKMYEERIRHMAQHDSLTQLPNRVLFYDRLDQAIKIAKRKVEKFALFYLDLDRFKLVNDHFGHDTGDRVLIEVARRMRDALRASDTLARLGGDEFAVIACEIVSANDVVTVAQKLIDVLTLPYTLTNVPKPIDVGVSIGIAVFPGDSESMNELVKAADDAMYRAKQTGNTFSFFSSDAAASSRFL